MQMLVRSLPEPEGRRHALSSELQVNPIDLIKYKTTAFKEIKDLEFDMFKENISPIFGLSSQY